MNSPGTKEKKNLKASDEMIKDIIVDAYGYHELADQF